jgi:hypothetical protein
MAMQVKHLIEELQEMDPDLYVILSSDAEGNAFNFLQGIAINQKLSEGYVYLSELTEELEDEGYTEEDVCADGVACVVFYPGDDTTMLEKLIAASNQK